MSPASLSLVAPNAQGLAAEAPAQRARRLMAEARSAAAEQVEMLESMLSQVAEMAMLVAEGGDAYAPGVRELCSRVAGEATWSVQTLTTIQKNAARG